MERRPQPYCEDCLVSLSVRHLLAECLSFADIRRRLYPATENCDTTGILRIMLAERPNEPFNHSGLFDYLREVNVINEVI